MIKDVEEEHTLRPECHWNTELLLYLSVIERNSEEADTKLLELVYMIETTDGILIPVNIGEQAAEIAEGKIRVALVKQLIHGGHVFLLKESLRDGMNILPAFLTGVDRTQLVSFYKNQIRADVNKNSKLSSVLK